MGWYKLCFARVPLPSAITSRFPSLSSYILSCRHQFTRHRQPYHDSKGHAVAFVSLLVGYSNSAVSDTILHTHVLHNMVPEMQTIEK